MLLAGDECRRTQQGNNNAWCQDNPVSWFDWSLVDRESDLVRFVATLVRFRLGNPTLRRRTFLRGGASDGSVLPDVEWFSPEGVHIDWYAADGSLACCFGAPTPEQLRDDEDPAAGGSAGTPRHVLIFAHAGSAPRTFRFPDAPALRQLSWRVIIDTCRLPPDDIHAEGVGPPVDPEQPLDLPERSLLCLVADPVPAPVPGRRRVAGQRP
jgi:glycogen operon protein